MATNYPKSARKTSADVPVDYNAYLLQILQQKGSRAGGERPVSIARRQQFGPEEPEAKRIAGEKAGKRQIPGVGDFLEGWDYIIANNTDKRGPNGQALPYGAIEWNPKGKASYGRGLPGWFNKFVSKIVAPINTDTSGPILAIEARPGTPEDFVDIPGKFQTAEFLNVGQTAKNIFEYAKAGGGDVGEKPNIFALGTRIAAGLIGGLLGGLGEVAEKTEQVLFGVTKGLEEAGEGAPLESPSLEHIKERLPDVPLIQAIPAWYDFFMQAAPGVVAYNAVRAILSKKPLEEKIQDIDSSYNAGRIAYSAFIDPAIRQEYITRYENGENPHFLAMELENPIAELVGELIFDPLNFLGIFAKGARNTKRIASVADEFFNLPKAWDEFASASKALSETAAAERITDMAKLQVVKSKDVLEGVQKLVLDNRLAALTADGKKYVVGRRTGLLADWIIREAKNVGQDPVEIFRGLILANGNDNLDEVATGLAAIKNFIEPRPLLSRAGDELGIMMRRMLTDSKGKLNAGDWLDELADIKKPEKMVEFANNKITGAIDGMFPTVAERIAKGEDIGPGLRALSKFHGVMNGKLYKPINTFFAGVYMGLSPGYAFRNMLSNYIHILVDEGPGALRHIFRPKNWIDKSKRWLLGAVPAEATAGFGGTKGMEVLELIKGRGMLGLSEKFERNAAAHVVGYTVDQTMRRMLVPGRALPEFSPLINAGLSETSTRHLYQLVMENHGDIDKAVVAFGEAVGRGQIEAFRTLDWMKRGDVDALHAFGLTDEMRDILKTPTLTEARESVAKLFDEISEDAERLVRKDVSAVTEDIAAIDDVRIIGGTDMSTVFKEDAQNLWQANAWSLHFSRQVMEDVGWGALAQAAQQAPDKLDEINEINKLFAGYRHGINTSEMKRVSEAFNERWVGQWLKPKQAARGRGLGVNIADAWRELGVEGPPPQTWADFSTAFWEKFFRPKKSEMWNAYRDEIFETAQIHFDEINKIIEVEGSVIGMERAREFYEHSRKFDDFIHEGAINLKIEDAIAKGDNVEAAVLRANQYGIPSISEAGADLAENSILNRINANLPEGMEKFEKLADVPPDVSQKALLQHVTKERGEGAAEAIARLGERPIPPYSGGAPTPARVRYEQRGGLAALKESILRDLEANWGKTESIVGDAKIDAALNAWKKGALKGAAEARLTSINVANAAREFTLLSYPQKKNMDLVLGYIFPYQFWYNRTYQNWLQRIAQSPHVIAGYAKYKDTLASIHAGAPEWWKYNVNTNELFGLDSENPLFFNLEATLNPLNGLTGVDFNDPKKRTGWFTAALDDLGKFGPSTWTPFSLATAFALHMKGEEDAAARWGSRLIPQTATLKSITAALSLGPPGGLELDPNVHFFSNGHDPHERRRIGRELGVMVDERIITRAESMDAAHAHEGGIWDMALDRSTKRRAFGQLTGQFFGVGFKARNVSDIEIDKFYNEYYRFWEMEDNMSSQEVREGLDAMRQKYPFMETVLLSRKGGLDRDRSLAYNVLGRIPPGQKSELAEAAGIDVRLLDKFYSDKGHLEKWATTERGRFMDGVIDIAAILDLPDDATQTEWREASFAYQDMRKEAERLFGSDAWDLVDSYFTKKKDEGSEAANAYLDVFPIVGDILDWKSRIVLGNPLLSAYYGSVSVVESYYRGLMYDAIEKELGPEVWDTWDEYRDMKENLGDAKAFWKEHPELERYNELKDDYEAIIARSTIRAVEAIPEGRPAVIRPDAETETFAQQDIRDVIEQEEETSYSFTWEDWQQVLSVPMQGVIQDYAYAGDELPDAAERQLERIAEEFDISMEVLLEQIILSLP